MAEMLRAANGGATKTQIMYKSFLSYAQLQDYLSVLLENSLIGYDKEEREFKSTPKGLLYLDQYVKMQGLMPNIGSGLPSPIEK